MPRQSNQSRWIHDSPPTSCSQSLQLVLSSLQLATTTPLLLSCLNAPARPVLLLQIVCNHIRVGCKFETACFQFLAAREFHQHGSQRGARHHASAGWSCGNVGGPAWAAPAAVIATLRSLSLALQNLFNRLASTRLSRGDAAGAERARNIANQVGNGLQWWTGMGTLSWDYFTNYVFQQSLTRGVGVTEALGHLSALASIVGEVTSLRSDSERLQWMTRNYARAFTVAKSAMGNLLTVFDHDGAIRNCVLAIQRELLEGDLLRDVLRLGPNDLEGVVRMSKDVLQRIFVPAQPGQRGDL